MNDTGWITTADVGERSLENPRVPLDPWHQAAGGGLEGDVSASGVRVGESKALTVSGFWRGLNLVSRSVAKLPLGVYRNIHPGREPDHDHPADWPIGGRPNPYMTPFVWMQAAMLHALLRGNAYNYVFRRGDGVPLELLPLDPTRTHPVREGGRLWYVHELKGGEKRKLPAEDVLHFKGLSGDGLEGYDVLHKARESLGLAIATTTYGSTFFRNSARPNVLLRFPKRLSPEARKNLRESWERMHAGLDNAHRTAILEDGGDATPLTINARDSQLLESRQFSLIDFANWLSVPPHRLGANISTSYGSLEQENQNLLDDGFDPWLVMIEQECEAKLLREEERRQRTHAIAFDRFRLVQADMDKRGNYYEKAVKNGWLNFDEVRGREGINPMPGGLGKVYARQLNVAYVGGDPAGPGVAAGAELLDLPDVRQSQAWDCGPAALNAVLTYLERDAVTAAQLGTTPERGTSPAQVLAVLARLAVAATAKGDLTVEDLARFFRAGQPVLCPCRPPEAPGGHWMAVLGVGLGQVYLHDPMSGRRMMSEESWLECWADTDADGNEYTRFGIAVGEELAPSPPSAQAAGTATTADATAGDDGGTDPAAGGLVTDPTDATNPAAGPPPHNQMGEVQDTALNGAQVGAMLEIVTQQATGVIPAAAALAMLQAAFPLVPAETLQKIVEAVAAQPAPKPEPTPAPAPEPKADEPVAAEAERSKVLLATERALGEALGRCVRRLRHKAHRATRRPGEFVGWLDGMVGAESPTLNDMIAAPLAAWCGASGRAAHPTTAADRLAGEVRAGLLEVSGGTNADGLALEVGMYFDAIEADVWATGAGKYLTGEADEGKEAP